MTFRIATLFFVLPALVAAREPAPPGKAASQDKETRQTPNPSARVTVIQVFYYAKPGMAAEVLSQRQHASDVLEKLGLPRGRVMRRVGGSEDQPEVTWECDFPSPAALEQFLKPAAASPEFEEVRKHMGALIRNAERRDWQVP